MSGRQLIHVAFFLSWASILWSQEANLLDAAKIKQERTFIGAESGWLLWQGSHENGADPALDDTNWTPVGSSLAPEDLARVRWRGYGWFRCKLQVPQQLRGQDLSARFNHWGAAEIYLNGALIRQFGQVGSSPAEELGYIDRSPFLFPLSEEEEQVLAVYFSGFAGDLDQPTPRNKGFVISLEAPYPSLQRWWSNRSGTLTTFAFFLGFFWFLPSFTGCFFSTTRKTVPMCWLPSLACWA